MRASLSQQSLHRQLGREDAMALQSPQHGQAVVTFRLVSYVADRQVIAPSQMDHSRLSQQIPMQKLAQQSIFRDPNFPATPVVDNSETRTSAFAFPDTTPSNRTPGYQTQSVVPTSTRESGRCCAARNTATSRIGKW